MKTLAEYPNRARGRIREISPLDGGQAIERQEYRPLQISASLLAANDVQESTLWAVAACRAGAERIHIDVNDYIGKPNRIGKAKDSGSRAKLFISHQLHSIQATLREAGFQIPIDVHLAAEQPSEALLASYIDGGASTVAIHWGSLELPTLIERLEFIHSYSPSTLAALAVAPEADIDAVGSFLNANTRLVGIVSLCAVTPGLGGLPFQPRVLGYLKRLRSRYGFRGIIQIDGGIEPKHSAPMAREAGADILVSGSAFFGRPDVDGPNIKKLRTAYLSLRGIDTPRPRIYASSKPINSASDPPSSLALRCLDCENRVPATRLLPACEVCGGKLEFTAAKYVNFTESITERPDLWRYQRLMPVPEKLIINSGEGYTPVILLEDLSKRLGITLYAKLESENPTGTFKDREASFVISRSAMAGLDNLVMQSTGNTGIAITYYAGLAGLDSFFFAPACSAYKLIAPPKSSYNKIILVKGHPVDVKNYAMAFSKKHHFPKISPFHERSEANATQAYEIGEAILDGQMPNMDFYVQTIAAGMGPIGFHKGITRLARWTNNKVTVPRIVAVQISEFAPAQRAWEQNLDELGLEAQTPTYGVDQPFEPTLHTTNAPAYYPYLRQALKASKGILMAVEPRTVLSCESELCDSLASHNYILADTEKSAFVGYAGLVELVRCGSIPCGSTVLLMVTGKGVKPHFKVIEPDAIIPPDYTHMLLLKQLRAGKLVRAVPCE